MHVSHTHDFTESGQLFPLQSTNNKVIYLYMNTRTKYERHVFYLKHCLGLAILGNCALPSTDLIFIILHWRQSHLSFFSSQSPFIFFLTLPYFSSILQCCWMLMSQKRYKTTVSLFQIKSSGIEGPTFFHFGVPTEDVYLALSSYIKIS